MDRVPPVSTRITRLAWLAAGGAAAAVLLIARALAPDPAGVGTHEQLGLPPCGFHQLTGLPCPTCGLTTSFAHMARGQVTAALHAHWLGPPLFVLTAVIVVLCTCCAVTAVPLAHAGKRLRLARLLAIIAATAMIVWLLRLLLIVLP